MKLILKKSSNCSSILLFKSAFNNKCLRYILLWFYPILIWNFMLFKFFLVILFICFFCWHFFKKKVFWLNFQDIHGNLKLSINLSWKIKKLIKIISKYFLNVFFRYLFGQFFSFYSLNIKIFNCLNLCLILNFQKNYEKLAFLLKRIRKILYQIICYQKYSKVHQYP